MHKTYYLKVGNLWHPVVLGFPGGTSDKELPAIAGVLRWQDQSLSWEDLLEEGMKTHSSILAWRNPMTEDPGGLWSIGLQRVRHD